MEGPVELPHFGNGVDLPGIGVVALHGEGHGAHHPGQSRSRRQPIGAELGQEGGEVACLIHAGLQMATPGTDSGFLLEGVYKIVTASNP